MVLQLIDADLRPPRGNVDFILLMTMVMMVLIVTMHSNEYKVERENYSA